MARCPFTGKQRPDAGIIAGDKVQPCVYAKSHGFGYRNGEEHPPGQFVKSGKFGRMFPKLPALQAEDAQLEALGLAMRSDDLQDNPLIPAGFTYLGQFLDHDITFDTTGLQEQIDDPTAVQNFRTPKLDLDSLYGAGPTAQPFLYQRQDNALFQIGLTNDQPGRGDAAIPTSLPHDLPRSRNESLAGFFALIGDPRNDENLAVAQLHLAMLRFHNKVVAHVRASGQIKRSAFEDARQLVIWHYQWIVLHEFLRKLLDPAQLDDVLTNGRKFYKFEDGADEPFIPLEFSVAAYRLGHSLVREEYDYNRVFGFGPGAVTPATLGLFFKFSGLSNSDLPDEVEFKRVVPIPSDWIIDWRRFFDLGPRPAGVFLNPTMRLDPFLTGQLHDLPNSGKDSPSLAVRNLIRSRKMALPSGQDVAGAMSFTPLTEAEIASGADGATLRAQNLHFNTPLWYYILKEALVQQNGERLGQVGSRILAEVFVGLLQGDGSSFLATNPNWTPTLPAKEAGKFTMADLLTFMGEINPIGDAPAEGEPEP